MRKFLFLIAMLPGIFLLGQEVPDDWTPDSGLTTYQETNDPHGGTYACKVVVDATSNVFMTNDVIITGLTEGDDCKATAWAKSSTNVKVQIRMIFNDPASTSGFSNASQGDADWVSLSKNMVVPTGATGVTLKFRFSPQAGFSPGEEQWVDDLTLESPLGTDIPVTNGDMESWPENVVEPNPGDLIINEINATSDPDFKARYTELYNTTVNTLNLSKILVKYFDNGATVASDSVQLSGTLAPGDYLILARDASFNTTYAPLTYDFLFTAKLNGGLDAMVIEHEDNGILDQFNDGPPATASWAVTHLFYRFDSEADGSSLADHWDDAGTNKPGTPKAANTYTFDTETGNGNWNTATNWDNGNVPTRGVNVIIPAGTDNPFIGATDPSAPNECLNVTFDGAGAQLTVGPGKYLTVHGDANIPSDATGFFVRSTDAGNGSLIVEGTVTGDATVQRYVDGYTTAADGWHLIGAPVDMTIAGTGWEPGTTTPDIDDLYYWSETQELWKNYKANAFDFEQGKGYLAAFESTQTNNFIGALTTADFTLTNLSKDNEGWHLIGNPFASAIEWNNNGDWVFTNVGNVPALWDESGATYLNPAVGDPVPSTNAFFVQVSDATNTLTIPASARMHDAQNNYKKSTVNNGDYTLRMKVSTTANTFYNKIRVAFAEGATNEWDMQYDARKLFGNAAAPELWTVSDGESFSVNTLPFTLDPVDLPLHFKAGADGEYTIAFDGVESFDGTTIVLEDLFTEQTVDLSESQTYSYTALQEDDYDRFVLHFYGVTDVMETPQNESSDAVIYSARDRVYIRYRELPETDIDVEVYNTIGQRVYQQRMSPAALNSFTLQAKPGMYVVRVESGTDISVAKVMVN